MQAATSNQFNNSRQQHVHVSLTGISHTAKLIDSVPSQRLTCTLYYVHLLDTSLVVSFEITVSLFPSVTLISSDVSVCPGGSLVFTCTSDARKLVWESDGDFFNFLYYKKYERASTVHIFTVKLTNVTGMLLISTATVHNAQLSHNGTIITCYDFTRKRSPAKGLVQISGQYQS